MTVNHNIASNHHLPGLYYIIDSIGNIANCNFGLAKLLNFSSPEMLVGLNLYTLLTDHWEQELVDKLAQQNREILASQQSINIKEVWHAGKLFISYKTPIENQLQIYLFLLIIITNMDLI
jgi:PAS domain-containing protein